MSACRGHWTRMDEAQRFLGAGALLSLGSSFVFKVLVDDMALGGWLRSTLIGFLTLFLITLLLGHRAKRRPRRTRSRPATTGAIGAAGVGLGLLLNRLSDALAAFALAAAAGLLLGVSLGFLAHDQRAGGDASDSRGG